MHFSHLIPLLPLVAGTSIPLQPQHIFANPSEQDASSFKIPTRFESAVIARRVLHLTPLGTLSTIFPSPHSHNQDESSSPSALENRPSGLQGMPIGLTDYVADCEPQTGNPTILAINIATSFKNVAAGSNISLSVQWTPPYPPKSRIESTFTSISGARTEFSAANLPRFSLLGYLEKIPREEVEVLALRKCFTDTHPDAKYWLPGNRIHSSEWVRLVVQDVYFIGGFGDRAYIGWIPVEEWRNVTSEMVEDIRLPGEKKGWKEWAVDSMGSIWEL